MNVDLVDAMQMAARGSTVQRTYPVGDLPRLRELAGNSGNQAGAQLEARFQLLNRDVAIGGRVTATLRANCQRCLRPVDIDLVDEFAVTVVGSEAELERLPESQDAIVADATKLDLAWLTEEQLLLAMPLVPLHAMGQCAEQGQQGEQQVEVPAESSDAKSSQRPFANLRDLLNRR